MYRYSGMYVYLNICMFKYMYIYMYTKADRMHALGKDKAIRLLMCV